MLSRYHLVRPSSPISTIHGITSCDTYSLPGDLRDRADNPNHLKPWIAHICRHATLAVPAGVACQSDRAAFELLCLLWADIRSDSTNVIPAMSAQLRAMLASFGMTPSSRAALSVPPPPRESNSEASKFFDDLHAGKLRR